MANTSNATSTRDARGAVKREPRSGEAEAGFTLVELSVAMLIMAIFLGISMGSVIHLLTPASQAQAMRDSTSQLDLAFLTLDHEIRYSSVVFPPYQVSNNDFVEFESTYNSQTNATCTEVDFAVATGTLQQRTWSAGSPPTNPPSGPSYHVLATGLVANPQNPTSNVFSLPSPASTSPYHSEELSITLWAASGSGQARELAESSVTFTAVDSTSSTPPTSAPLPSLPYVCSPQAGWTPQ